MRLSTPFVVYSKVLVGLEHTTSRQSLVFCLFCCLPLKFLACEQHAQQLFQSLGNPAFRVAAKPAASVTRLGCRAGVACAVFVTWNTHGLFGPTRIEPGTPSHRPDL